MDVRSKDTDFTCYTIYFNATKRCCIVEVVKYILGAQFVAPISVWGRIPKGDEALALIERAGNEFSPHFILSCNATFGFISLLIFWNRDPP